MWFFVPWSVGIFFNTMGSAKSLTVVNTFGKYFPAPSPTFHYAAGALDGFAYKASLNKSINYPF